jgi:hypothetical protein
LHYGTNCSLDVDPVVAVNRDQAGLTADGREIDKGAIVVHRLPDLIQPAGEHPIELARKNGGVSGNDAFALSINHDQSAQVCHPKSL